MELSTVKIAREKALKSKGLIVRDQANNKYFSRGSHNTMIWLDDEQTMISIMFNPDHYSNQKSNKPFLITAVSYVDILSIDGVGTKDDVMDILELYKSKMPAEEYDRAISIYKNK